MLFYIGSDYIHDTQKGMKNPTCYDRYGGFIQSCLPICCCIGLLEEIMEADVLLHVTDVNNESWRKQEAAVLKELSSMGLEDKPVVTIWNKIDTAPGKKEYLKLEASKRSQTVALSSVTGEGFESLKVALEEALSSTMMYVSMTLPYDDNRCRSLLSTIHNLGVLEEVSYNDDGTYIRGFVPEFLQRQIQEILDGFNEDLLFVEEEEACVMQSPEKDIRSDEGLQNRSTERLFQDKDKDKDKSAYFNDSYWRQVAKGDILQ